MIISILIGKKDSIGFPGKNTYKINNIPMSVYPMLAARGCKNINKHYISTDDEILMNLGRQNGFEIIKRPENLCKDASQSDDVYIHAYNYIKEENKNYKIDIVVMLMCNAPIITSDKISEGIKELQKNSIYDSAITVSKYNMWTPFRALKIKDNGLLSSFINFESLNNSKNINCDRNSQGNVWFADSGAFISRSSCIEKFNYNYPVHKLIGVKIYPIKQELGLDVDYEWQIPQIEKKLNKIYDL